MTDTKAPFGLRPGRKRGGSANNEALNTYRIANGQTGDIFYGDPVFLLSTGTICLLSATATAGVALGVFQGCVYNNPSNGNQPTFSRRWISATSATDGTKPYAYVLDDSRATFLIQADASITAGDVGYNFPVSLGAGTTLTGSSTTVLKAASRTVATALLQVVGIYDTPDNAYSNEVTTDLYPIVEVRWNMHRDNIVSI